MDVGTFWCSTAPMGRPIGRRCPVVLPVHCNVRTVAQSQCGRHSLVDRCNTVQPAATWYTILAAVLHLSGWLVKEGHIIKNWRLRWFVLRGSVVSYYRSIDDANPIKVGRSKPPEPTRAHLHPPKRPIAAGACGLACFSACCTAWYPLARGARMWRNGMAWPCSRSTSAAQQFND